MAANIRQPLQDDRTSTALHKPAGGAEETTRPFATLTPVNVLAKLAFSDVFEATRLRGQKTQNGDPLLRMVVQDEQCYDKDVARFRMDEERRRETNESLTEPDTDAEASNDGGLGMIWTGWYVFALEPEPSSPELGWTVGKDATEPASCGDLILSTKAFAKQYSIPLRTFHARFNFAQDIAAFFVARIPNSSYAELTVNGTLVDRRMHRLNQHIMRIRISSLEYTFQYTKFAASHPFFELRRDFIARALGGRSTSSFDMPTPSQETTTMGQWTLAHPLGKGAKGRVF